jgi:hypothetical protein
MILFKNVGSVLAKFEKASHDLELMMERDAKRNDKLTTYKEKVALKAERKIKKAEAKRRIKRELANERKANLKADLTRAAIALEKLNEIAGY